MTDLADLERRIRVLEDVAAIKELKYRYWRCIRDNLWDETAACFSEDGFVDFPDTPAHGRQAIAKVYKFMAGYFAKVCPQGHNPEIKFTSETTATGLWYNDNFMHEAKSGEAGRLGVLYEDEYVKVNGEWLMKSSKAYYAFKEVIQLGELPRGRDSKPARQ